MIEWQKVKLGDVCDLIAGFAFKSSDFGSYPDKVIKITNIEPPFVNTDSLMGVDLNSYNKIKLEKYIAKKGDYVLAMTGATIGKLGRIYKSEAYINQRVLMFKNKSLIDKRFLYYVLADYNFLNYITNHIDSESAQANISASTIGKYIFPLPPLDIQRKIAGILGALDDRIDVLRRENVVLEQMAQAVFQSWFVDFDIVRAKAAGTPESEVCEKYHITPELYALFPSALTPDNLPLGWEKKNLGDISQYSKEKTTNVNIETYVSTENMLPNYGGIEKASSVPETGQSTRYKAGNVLISNIRPYFKKIWFADREGSCSNDVLVFSSNSIGKCMLYSILAQDAFFDFVMSGANGDKMPRGNKKHIMTYPVIFPNMDLLNKFENLVASLFDKKSKNAQQIRALSATRDALLPKLMNGEIEV